MKKLLAVLLIALSPHLFAETKTLILTNHIGYEADRPKQAVILCGENDSFPSFSIKKSPLGETILTGKPNRTGSVQNWKEWYFWTISFDALQKEGEYYIECSSANEVIRSFPFQIRTNLLEKETISNVLYYFKGQRCSGAFDKADSHLPMNDTLRKEHVDVHGGWYDATGDYGKHLTHLSASTYFNPQQIPLTVWSLLKSLEQLEKRAEPNFKQYKRRMLDEALHGADFLVRMKIPDGSFYRTVQGRGPGKKAEDRYLLNEPVGYRSGAGMAIAALARASTLQASGEFDNRVYLHTAEDAFHYLEKHNAVLTNDKKENIVDDYCALIAATELFNATKKQEYKIVATKRAQSLMSRLTSDDRYRNYWRADDKTRPFFHAADAGLPVVSLLSFSDIADEAIKKEVLEVVKKSMLFELSITTEVVNPFGYSRQLVQNKSGVKRTTFFFPHDTEAAPWWQGENARLGSMASAARLCIQYFQSDTAFIKKLSVFSTNQLNWILGLNPFDCCMLHGSGRNNPAYMFFNSYEYTNAPGGICNGITGGMNDDGEGIEFNIPYRISGGDHDWRWTEQWLPHASWFLLAVCAGN